MKLERTELKENKSNNNPNLTFRLKSSSSKKGNYIRNPGNNGTVPPRKKRESMHALSIKGYYTKNPKNNIIVPNKIIKINIFKFR